MKSYVIVRGVLAASIAAIVGSGCGAQSKATMPLPETESVPGIAIAPQAGPAACKGQKATKQYAKATETLNQSGGMLCIPAFQGFGGLLPYPGPSSTAKFTIISSTTNYLNWPNMGSGKATFYLQINGPTTTFGSTVGTKYGLTSSKIKVNAPYTTYLIYLGFGGLWHSWNQCYSIAQKGKFGGVIPRIGSLLKGLSLNFQPATTITLEVYPYQAFSPC